MWGTRRHYRGSQEFLFDLNGAHELLSADCLSTAAVLFRTYFLRTGLELHNIGAFSTSYSIISLLLCTPVEENSVALGVALG
jgi:hypothetical protein